MDPKDIAKLIADWIAPIVLAFAGQEFSVAIRRFWRWMSEGIWRATLFFRFLWHHDLVAVARAFHRWMLVLTASLIGLSVLVIALSSEECGPHHYPWWMWILLIAPPTISLIRGLDVIILDSEVKPIDWGYVQDRINFRKGIADATFRMPTIPPGLTPDQIQAIEEPVLRQRAERLRELLEGPNGIGPEVEARSGASNRSPLVHGESAIITTFVGFVTVAAINLLFVGGSWTVQPIFMDPLTIIAAAFLGLILTSVSFYLLLPLSIVVEQGTFVAHLVDGVLVRIATIPPGITDENVRSVIAPINGESLIRVERWIKGVTGPLKAAYLTVASMAIWAHIGVLVMFTVMVLGTGGVIGFFRPTPTTEPAVPAAPSPPPPLTFIERVIQGIVIAIIVIRALLSYANRYLGYPLQHIGGFLVSVASHVTGLGALDHGPDPGDYLILAGRLVLVYGIAILVLAVLVIAGIMLVAAHRSRPMSTPVRVVYATALVASLGWLGLMGIGSSGHKGFDNPFPIPTCDARATIIARSGTTPSAPNASSTTVQPTTIVHYPPLPPLPQPPASPQSGREHRGHRHGSHRGGGMIAVGIDTAFSCTPAADAPLCSEIMPYNRQALRETCGCR